MTVKELINLLYSYEPGVEVKVDDIQGSRLLDIDGVGVPPGWDFVALQATE